MRILTAADDSGSLKEIVCPKGTDTSSQAAPQPEKIETFNNDGLKNRVQRLLVIKAEEEEIIVAARANGHVHFYKSETYEPISSISEGLETSTKDQFISLIYTFGAVFAASEQGKVTAIDIKTIHKDAITTKTTSVKGPLSTFVSHPTQEGIFAFGGKENDVKIVKLYEKGANLFGKEELKPEILFQGKNVKNDKLDLRVPIWITNILFVKISEHTEQSWKFITTTGYGQVRRYDTSHGRKPVLDKKVSEKPLVRVVNTLKEDEIICADTHVTTALFNIEKGILIAKFKGSVGAVEALYSHLRGKGGLLVTGALDRYVRVFDINTREQVAKVYVGSKISAVWLLTEEDTEAEVKQKEEDPKRIKKMRKKAIEAENEDEDEVWNKLDELENKATKKRRV